MPENNKRSTPRLLIAAMGLTAGLMMAPQTFAGSMGYVTNSAGEAWKVSGELHGAKGSGSGPHVPQDPETLQVV